MTMSNIAYLFTVSNKLFWTPRKYVQIDCGPKLLSCLLMQNRFKVFNIFECCVEHWPALIMIAQPIYNAVNPK